MTTHQKNEAFLLDILKNKEVLQKAAENPQGYKEVMKALVDECNANGADGKIPGGPIFRIKAAIGEVNTYTYGAIKEFSEQDMLRLYKNMFDPWFRMDNFREVNALNNPIFQSIQTALTATTKANYVTCFQYLTDNIDAHKYDIDGLDMVIAIQEKHQYILETMWMNLDKSKYGFEGSLSCLIHPRLKDAFNNASWMSPILRDKLNDFRVLN